MKKLRWGSTWALFGLSIITYAVYLVHYARRQSLILNQFSPPEKQISMGFVYTWFVITYTALAFFFVYFFVPDDSVWATIGTLFDRIDGLFGLIWAFMARGSLHRLLQAQKGTPAWFHGFWTFLFQIFYINFKINKILGTFVSPAETIPVSPPAA